MKAYLQLLPLALAACATTPDERAPVPPPTAQAVTAAVGAASDTAAASVAELRKLLALPGVELTPAARLAVDGHLSILEALTGKPSVKAAEAAAALTAALDAPRFRQAALDAEAGRRKAEETLQAAQSEALRLREERDQARKDAETNSRLWRDRALYAVAALVALAGAAAIALGIYLTQRRLTVVGAALLPCSGVIGWIPQLLGSAAFQRAQDAVAYCAGAVLLGLIGFGAYEVVKWLRTAKARQVATVVGTAAKAAR